MSKGELLAKIENLILTCSRLDPPPVDFIDNLETVKAWAETANSDELAEIQEWWDRVQEATSC